jgi:hypothetical protein
MDILKKLEILRGYCSPFARTLSSQDNANELIDSIIQEISAARVSKAHVGNIEDYYDFNKGREQGDIVDYLETISGTLENLIPNSPAMPQWIKVGDQIHNLTSHTLICRNTFKKSVEIIYEEETVSSYKDEEADRFWAWLMKQVEFGTIVEI